MQRSLQTRTNAQWLGCSHKSDERLEERAEQEDWLLRYLPERSTWELVIRVVRSFNSSHRAIISSDEADLWCWTSRLRFMSELCMEACNGATSMIPLAWNTRAGRVKSVVAVSSIWTIEERHCRNISCSSAAWKVVARPRNRTCMWLKDYEKRLSPSFAASRCYSRLHSDIIVRFRIAAFSTLRSAAACGSEKTSYTSNTTSPLRAATRCLKCVNCEDIWDTQQNFYLQKGEF